MTTTNQRPAVSNAVGAGGGDQSLSGQQMQTMAARYAEELGKIRKDVELRKWSIDQACGLAGAQVEAEAPTIMHPVQLAREIHAFLVEAAKDQETT